MRLSADLSAGWSQCDNDGVPGDLLTTNVREPTEFFPGAELFVRDRAAPSAQERSLTAGIFPDDEDGNPPLYDVKDISASADGLRLAFAMRALSRARWSRTDLVAKRLNFRRVIEKMMCAQPAGL